jgi:hypothetical protein
MKRFRIKYDDEVIVRAFSQSGKLLAVYHDSGFTTIQSCVSAALQRIPYYGGKTLEIQITNKSKEESIRKVIKVNQ